MSSFLKFGVLSVTPLSVIVFPFLNTEASQNNSKTLNRNNSVNLDEPIMLINRSKLDFGAPCEFLVKGEGQQLFNNSEELLNYFFKDPKKLIFENFQISFPKKIFQTLSDNSYLRSSDLTQHKQRISFQKDQESSGENYEIFQKLWNKWTSRWDSKSQKVRKIIFGVNESNDLSGNVPEMKQLYKCYNGNWYGFIFNSTLSIQEIEEMNFKNWIINHIGIL